MKVEILEFINEPKNNQVGVVDCKVSYTPDKFEIFRNLSVWKRKDGKLNVSFGNVKRGEKWVSRFERTPYPKEMLEEILRALDEYRRVHPDISIADY
jgi:hypothetical protein